MRLLRDLLEFGLRPEQAHMAGVLDGDDRAGGVQGRQEQIIRTRRLRPPGFRVQGFGSEALPRRGSRQLPPLVLGVCVTASRCKATSRSACFTALPNAIDAKGHGYHMWYDEIRGSLPTEKHGAAGL